MKYNILEEAAVTNADAAQNTLSSPAISQIITGQAQTLTGVISLDIDLSIPRSLSEITYSASSYSGASLWYGRMSDTLVSGAAVISGGVMTVAPSEAGYSQPRYIRLIHDTGTGTEVSGLSVFNDPDDINFNALKSDVSLSLAGGLEAGKSQIQELRVYNNTEMEQDIYVTVDTNRTEFSLLDNLEADITETGVSGVFDPLFDFPNVIPFEWGRTDTHAQVTESGITLRPDASFINVGDVRTYGANMAFRDDSPNYPHFNEAKFASGRRCFYIQGRDYRITMLDPYSGLKFTSSSPGLAALDGSSNPSYTPAWDGDDRIYFWEWGSKNLWYYTISTNSFTKFGTISSLPVNVVYNYAPVLVYKDGYVYSAYSSSYRDFRRINVNTGAVEALTSMPSTFPGGSFNDIGGRGFEIDGYIYICASNGAPTWLIRWNPKVNSWETLPNPPQMRSWSGSGSGVDRHIVGNKTLKKIYYMYHAAAAGSPIGYYEFDIGTLQWSSTMTVVPGVSWRVGDGNANMQVYRDIGFGINDTTFLFGDPRSSYYNVSPEYHYVYVIDTPPIGASTVKSGSFTTPILVTSGLTGIGSIVPELEIPEVQSSLYPEGRLSDVQINAADSHKSFQNMFEFFNSNLDSSVYYTQRLAGTSILVQDQSLVFEHLNSASQPGQRSGLLYFNLPLNSAGLMHYRFWWNPPSMAASAYATKTRFYLVPYLDAVESSTSMSRDANTLYRQGTNLFYIQLGDSSDSGNRITKLLFWNSQTTATYPIDASSGQFYPIDLVVDWGKATYQIYFNFSSIGTGTLPLSLIQNSYAGGHTWEIISSTSNTGMVEKFKAISVVRLSDYNGDESIAVFPHLKDTVFGFGNGNFKTTTSHSILLGNRKYNQYKLTFPGYSLVESPRLTRLRFVKSWKLEKVPAQGYKSLYLRYNFPAVTQTDEKQIYFKAWMKVDKY